jgi:hypothetical protein
VVVLLEEENPSIFWVKAFFNPDNGGDRTIGLKMPYEPVEPFVNALGLYRS